MLRSFAKCIGIPGRWQPSPRSRRVSLRIIRFEACSVFTPVTACTLAEPPDGGPSVSQYFSRCRPHAPLRLLAVVMMISAGKPLPHKTFCESHST